MRQLIPLLLIASPLGAADIYVAATGNDGTGTGASGAPYREIRKGLQVAGAGDRVLVGDGHFKGFDVDTRNGVSGSPITIQAQGTGAIVDVTSDRADNRDTIKITMSSWIVIDGLRSFNATRAALRVDQSPHVTVRDCVFGDNTTWGLFTDFADDLWLENNECYGSVQQHGIYVSNTCTRPTVRRNRLHDNASCGLHMNGDVSQGGAGVITNAVVEFNVIYSNGALGGSGINCDGVQSSVFRGNLIYDAHGAGISLYQIDASAPAINDTVVANTIDVASNGKWCLQIHNGSSGAKVFDNVFATHNVNHGSLHIEGAAGLVGFQSDRNVFITGTKAVTPDDDSTYLTLAQWQAAGHDANSKASTPDALFVDWSTGNYQLSAASPALDAGVASFASVTAPAVDLLGTARPSGSAYDIGAYEVAAAGGTTTSGTTTSGTTTSGTTASGTSTSGTTTSGTTASGTSTSGTSTSGGAASGTATATSGATGGGAGGGSSSCGLGGGLGLIAALAAWRRRR